MPVIRIDISILSLEMIKKFLSRFDTSYPLGQSFLNNMPKEIHINPSLVREGYSGIYFFSIPEEDTIKVPDTILLEYLELIDLINASSEILFSMMNV